MTQLFLVAALLLPALSSSFLSPLSFHKRTSMSGGSRARAFAAGASARPTWLKAATDSATEGASAEGETYQFDAEVSRVMDIIINSLYSDKSVFLRELVSNAADACDKRRFLSLTEKSEAADISGVRIKGFEDSKTLVIQDDGVGMTKEELVNNLGRIANSGTAKFAEAMQASKSDDLSLIGQFGVGFYSGFLVADKMTVETRSAVDPSSEWHKWESEAGADFKISKADKPEPLDDSIDSAFEVGTRITLQLKPDCLEFSKGAELKGLLTKYSEFIEFPIEVFAESTDYKQVPDEEANKDLKEGEVEKMKTVPVTTASFERVNNQKPIWLRSPRDVNETEYSEFYKSAFKASYDDPMQHTHFSLEGQVECKAVLYIPGMLPFELSKDMFDQDTNNIKLYVKRVFINDQFDELIPRYLKFIRGVVDSDDLPLNVGREILQKSKVLTVINKRLVRKSLDMIQSVQKEGGETYMKFWKNFGKYIKVGVVEDENNIDELASLCRFQSTTSGDKFTSLDAYVERMKEDQKTIYYVSGEGKVQAEMSPSLEGMASKGYEVLYMVEPLDEIAMQTLGKYKDFNLKDASKETFEDDESSKKKKEEAEEQLKEAIEFLTETLKGKVEKVEVSTRLTDSPAAMVQGAYGMSPSMQRYMQAQAVAMGEDDSAVQGMMGNMNQVSLEINPSHPIIKTFARMVSAKKEEEAKDYGAMICDLAGITSGYNVEDPKGFSQRIMALMKMVDGEAGEDEGGVQDATVVEE